MFAQELSRRMTVDGSRWLGVDNNSTGVSCRVVSCTMYTWVKTFCPYFADTTHQSALLLYAVHRLRLYSIRNLVVFEYLCKYSRASAISQLYNWEKDRFFSGMVSLALFRFSRYVPIPLALP